MIKNAVSLEQVNLINLPYSLLKSLNGFMVKDEGLIERQIKQLIEVGVEDIFIVLGYIKEKFFYLEQKYSEVTFLINNTYGYLNNIIEKLEYRNFEIINNIEDNMAVYKDDNPYVIRIIAKKL